MPLIEWTGIVFMAVPGLNSLTYGCVFLFAPRWLARERATPFFIAHRTSTGLCLLAGGLFCLSSAVYVWLRLHG